MQKYKVYINNHHKFITDNWREFCSKYNLINAAGGVVLNDSNQILMIYRNGKWDLPKGKLENDEDIAQCAIREVKEECGLKDIEIVKLLKDTYHTYDLDGVPILKRTSWFHMKTIFTDDLVPQIEEGITKVVWVDKQNMREKLNNTYSSIRELISMIHK